MQFDILERLIRMLTSMLVDLYSEFLLNSENAEEVILL